MLLDHGMDVVEMVLEKRLHRIVSVDELQFGFMPERGTIDDVFLLRRMQEVYHARGKMLHMCFVALEDAFDSVSRKVLEWALRKKEILYVLVRSVMSLYDRAKTWVRVDSELLEEFEAKVRMHQCSVLSHFIFAVVVDVVTEFARDGALSKLLYADVLVLMSETIMGLRNKVLEWKEAIESKGLIVNLGRTKVVVYSGMTKDGMSKGKVDPCVVCSLRVKANSVLCLQCGKWIHC